MTTSPQGALIPEFTMGDRMRKAREVADLDQIEFARLIGVSRGTVSNYERGSIDRAKPIVIRAWAMATGVPTEWLEHGIAATTPPPSGTPNTPELDRLTRQKQSGRRNTHRGRATNQYLAPTGMAA